MNSRFCLDEMYCRRGIPMLKTRIQLPALWGGQPTEWMRSLADVTQQYAAQTIVPAVCRYYEGLPSVAEKMHFEPLEYRHIWHTQPHPNVSDLLTVQMETVLMRGEQILIRAVHTAVIHQSTGQLVRRRKTGGEYLSKKRKRKGGAAEDGADR